MEYALLLAAGAILGGMVVRFYLKASMKKLQKTNLENAYHAGFEKGVEKGRNDYESELRAFSQKALEEQVEIDKKFEKLKDLNYSINFIVEDDHQHDGPCSHNFDPQPTKKDKKKKSKKKLRK